MLAHANECIPDQDAALIQPQQASQVLDRLRQADLAAPEARAAAFDQQRAHYPMRREFASTRVEITDATPGLLAKIAGLGFSLERKD